MTGMRILWLMIQIWTLWQAARTRPQEMQRLTTTLEISAGTSGSSTAGVPPAELTGRTVTSCLIAYDDWTATYTRGGQP